jgi:hypothetical protein
LPAPAAAAAARAAPRTSSATCSSSCTRASPSRWAGLGAGGAALGAASGALLWCRRRLWRRCRRSGLWAGRLGSWAALACWAMCCVLAERRLVGSRVAGQAWGWQACWRWQACWCVRYPRHGPAQLPSRPASASACPATRPLEGRAEVHGACEAPLCAYAGLRLPCRLLHATAGELPAELSRGRGLGICGCVALGLGWRDTLWRSSAAAAAVSRRARRALPGSLGRMCCLWPERRAAGVVLLALQAVCRLLVCASRCFCVPAATSSLRMYGRSPLRDTHPQPRAAGGLEGDLQHSMLPASVNSASSRRLLCWAAPPCLAAGRACWAACRWASGQPEGGPG